MAFDQWFDDLAKDSARGLPRGQVFVRAASGAGSVLMAFLGLRPSAASTCATLCDECCRNNFPRGGRELEECLSLCHAGEGLCGPIVCPDGQ